jgi:hypothetical protein
MPFTSVCGKCGAKRIDAQLGLEPFKGNDQKVLYNRDIDWEETYRKMLEDFKAHGIDVSRLEREQEVEPRFITGGGSELKRSYWIQACANLEYASKRSDILF